jgi:hypothetical protein
MNKLIKVNINLTTIFPSAPIATSGRRRIGTA